ncbi:hypothetical protein EIP86_003120 [Pleurotus ostreatoroseus]|nr:hypothetical protein EIP86_003120 [Pleurotus ostreatoroseus]
MVPVGMFGAEPTGVLYEYEKDFNSIASKSDTLLSQIIINSQMAKRRRSSDDDSDEDASYEPKAKVRKGRAPATRSKKPKDPDRLASAEDQTLTELDTDERTMHPSSLHRINDAASLRMLLLKWYDTVHEIRGMPWRKPFDPTLNAEGRAQRAYEARTTLAESTEYNY